MTWLGHEMADVRTGAGGFLTLCRFIRLAKYRRAALLVAPMTLWRAVHIASVTVETECANTRGVQNALKALPAFVLPMAEAADVPSQVAIRVLVISSFVQLMVVGSVVDLRAATSQLWGAPVCVLPTVAVAVV